MSSHEIEDVLASIRRLVSDDLRPANRKRPDDALLLTPALRVVSADAAATRDPGMDAGLTIRQDWVPDAATLSAVADIEAEHLDFAPAAMRQSQPDLPVAPITRTAMQSAAEAFHAQDDEFVLSLSDSGSMILRGDAHQAAQQGHEAVFAVLTQGALPGHVPPVAELADAEGGAPVDDAPHWTVIDWNDPAQDSALDDRDDAESPGGDRLETLILPFVSTRRAGAAAADPDQDAGEVVDAVPVATGPAPEPDLQPPAAYGFGTDDGRPDPKVQGPVPTLELRNGLIIPDDVLGDDRFFAARAEPDVTEAELVDDAMAMAETAAFSDMSKVAGALSEAAPAPTPISDRIDATGVTSEALPGAAETVLPLAAAPRDDAAPPLTGKRIKLHLTTQASPPAEAPITNLFDTDAAQGADAPVTAAPDADIAATADPVAPLPEAAPDLPPLPRQAAKLSEAAFTRWPGWAQPDADEAAVEDDLAAPAAPAPETALQKKHKEHKERKAALQELTWADKAEAEIHRQLASELGTVTLRDVAATAPAAQLSEAALRDLVRNTIRDELAGKLGERITANVRKLVQMELQKTLSVQVAEFRSQRRDPTPEA